MGERESKARTGEDVVVNAVDNWAVGTMRSGGAMVVGKKVEIGTV